MPSNRDMKNGITEPIVMCLEKHSVVQLPDGRYPVLASLARSDRTLCGPCLNYWKPVQAPIIAEKVVHISAAQQVRLQRERQAAAQQERTVTVSKPVHARRPYEIKG